MTRILALGHTLLHALTRASVEEDTGQGRSTYVATVCKWRVPTALWVSCLLAWAAGG